MKNFLEVRTSLEEAVVDALRTGDYVIKKEGSFYGVTFECGFYGFKHTDSDYIVMYGFNSLMDCRIDFDDMMKITFESKLNDYETEMRDSEISNLEKRLEQLKGQQLKQAM